MGVNLRKQGFITLYPAQTFKLCLYGCVDQEYSCKLPRLSVLSICFVNCTSGPAFDSDVGEEMVAMGKLGTLEYMKTLDIKDGFRFYVSTNVELRRRLSEKGSSNKNTVVREKVTDEIIQLRKNTTGRARSYDGESIEIQFEPTDRNGVYRTIKFVLKSNSVDDFYYFFYEKRDESTGRLVLINEKDTRIRRTIVRGNLIKYGKDEDGDDMYYEVRYKGKKEPYLLYKANMEIGTKKRTLRGVR